MPVSWLEITFICGHGRAFQVQDREKIALVSRCQRAIAPLLVDMDGWNVVGRSAQLNLEFTTIGECGASGVMPRRRRSRNRRF